MCSFLSAVLIQIDSKVVDHNEIDNDEDKKVMEVEGRKVGWTEAQKEEKKKVKGEDDEIRQRLSFEAMLDSGQFTAEKMKRRPSQKLRVSFLDGLMISGRHGESF